jgi:hypothetical protein
MLYSAEHLRLDRMAGQSRRIVVWCEATGMVPQIERIAEPFGLEVCSSGGFDSVTDKHRIGKKWRDEKVTVLHIGDYDPGGKSIFDSLRDDIGAFSSHYGGDIEFVRVAITAEQAKQYDLPSAPPKEKDRRSFDSNETWQAEALEPRILAEILSEAIEQRVDRALYEAKLKEEAEVRETAIKMLSPDDGENPV